MEALSSPLHPGPGDQDPRPELLVDGFSTSMILSPGSM